jgi:hypothetical protein
MKNPLAKEDVANPYVGPRSFKRGEKLYGRSVEAARLFHLLLADRIVLFYSPSGAGKTSLLQTQLTERLQREGFDVIYDIRVGRKPAGTPKVAVNRYLLGAVLSMEEALEKGQQLPLDDLASMPFADYVKHIRELRKGRKRLALIFDQFEEIFADPTDDTVKREFFRVIGELIEDTAIYAVFSMREDWIARLDDYEELIPSRLKARLRLSLLTEEQAVEAIRAPAKEQGVDFKVAEQLAHDLARTTVMTSAGATREAYSVVEPVQLQVVCLTLWEKPRDDPQVIDSLGGVSVDNALADYYRYCIDTVVVEKKLAEERAVREWFSGLITARGIRTQILLDEDESAGLSNEAISVLVDKHLVRAEQRGGRTWFELSHDRLVNPIRLSNADWNVENLSFVQRRAAEWENAGRPANLLLRGSQLYEAKQWAEVPANAASLKTYEKLFLETSKAAQPPLEEKAVTWEMKGRPPEMLLRGTALKEAQRVAREKGLYQFGGEVRAFLVESRDTRTKRYIQILGIIIATSVVVYPIVLDMIGRAKDENVIKVAQYLDTSHTVGAETLNDAIDANKRIEEIVKDVPLSPRTRQVSIVYYAKPGDGPKLRAALSELGFEIKDAPPRVDEPTNCIWYDANVAESDVKLVALAILRAGGELRAVQKRSDAKNRIVVGYTDAVASEEPLTAEEIDGPSLSDLQRPLARQIGRGETEGIVTDVDAGMINWNGETVTFRLPPGAENIATGDIVRFELYQNARGGNYAVHVKRIAKRTGL